MARHAYRALTLGAALILAMGGAPHTLWAQEGPDARGGPAGPLGPDKALTADPFAADYAAAAKGLLSLLDFDTPIQATPGEASLGSFALDASEPKGPPYSLMALLSLARLRNPSLAAQAEGVRAAQEGINAAKARRLPVLSAETNGSLIGNPVGPISISAGELGEVNGVLLPAEDILIYKGMESTYYQFKLTGTLPLFTWGKIDMGIDAAKTGLTAAKLQRQRAGRELFLKLRGTHEALAYTEACLSILGLEERIGNRLVELAERSAQSGFMTKTELLSARIKLKEVKLAQAKAQGSAERLLSTLATECGLDSLRLEEVELSAPKAQVAIWSEDALYGLVERGSYDLALSQALVESQRKLERLAQAKAKGLPDIGLQVELSYSGSRFPFLETDWFTKDDYQLNISLGSTGSLFSDAVAKGEAAKAKAELAEQESKLSGAKAALRGFVRETILDADLERSKLEYSALKLQGQEAELAQKRALMLAGAGAEDDYLGAMMESLSTAAEAYSSLAQYRSKLLALEGAVGSAVAE